MADVTRVIADLTAEGDELDTLVAPLSAEQWSTDTPAAGWTIAHQIAHLAWTDYASLTAISDSEGFGQMLEEFGKDPLHAVDKVAEEWAAQPPATLLETWRAGRVSLANALAAVPEGTKIAWFGPPMSAASMATARLMETWAHGLDVADALGARRAPTSRLKNLAHLGVRTRNFAYMVNGTPAPAEEFRVELKAPDGDTWAWGPDDAAQRVTGPAEDFCLLVTQRAHRDDLSLVAVGDDAQHWLTIAQVFAGPPGGGRKPKGAA